VQRKQRSLIHGKREQIENQPVGFQAISKMLLQSENDESDHIDIYGTLDIAPTY